MALTPTNLVIQASQLPATFVGDPNAFFRAMIERMRIVSPTGISQFVIGDIEPTSNQGPWLKGGTQWWVWDDSLKTYVPLDISASETHWFQTGANIPTVTDPPVWLRTTSGVTAPGTSQGTPVGWYLYNGTSWVGFTELLDKEVTLSKMADGVRGAIITYDATNRPVLQSIGNPNDFLRVNAGGTDIEWAAADALSLKGLLSANLFGPLTDTGGYNAATQSVIINLSENREVFITAYVKYVMNNSQFSILSLTVDGSAVDYHRGEAGATTSGTFFTTLISRQNLAAGAHTLTVTMPGTPGVGNLLDPANNNGVLPVKFIVELL
jgi:hypothetical protein